MEIEKTVPDFATGSRRHGCGIFKKTILVILMRNQSAFA